MPVPMQNPQMQQLMSNPQLFAQLLQQMGGQPPNMQGAGQVPFPGQPPQGGMPPGGGPQPPQMGGQPGQPPMPGGQMPQQMAGAPPQPGQMPPGAPNGAPPGMPPRPPMMPQQGGMPPQGGMPQGGAPGPIPGGQPGGPQAPQMQGQPPMNPQMMQQIMQMMQQRQGGMQQPGQGMQGPGMQQGGNRFTPQELGALGRLGDTTVAHLTPGEMTVPPQVQTPKVLATLQKEYHKKGVDPSQFTVGSPNSSINPSTGVPEYNFWSSLLPMALGGVGAMFGGPLGAAAGSGIGNLATGKDIGTSLLSAGLAGIGDYGATQLMGGASGSGVSGLLNSGGDQAGQAANEVASSPEMASINAGGSASQGALGSDAAGQAAQSANQTAAGQAGSGIFGNSQTAAAFAPNPLSLAQTAGNNISGNATPPNSAGFLAGLMNNFTTPGGWSGAAGGAAGAGLGGMLGQANANPPQPSGFNSPYKNASQLPGYQTLMGKDTYSGPTANFNNYNPATNYPASFNFFPTATNQNA